MSNKELKYLKADYHHAMYADHKKIGTDIVITILYHDAYENKGGTTSHIVTQEELDYILN